MSNRKKEGEIKLDITLIDGSKYEYYTWMYYPAYLIAECYGVDTQCIESVDVSREYKIKIIKNYIDSIQKTYNELDDYNTLKEFHDSIIFSDYAEPIFGLKIFKFIMRRNNHLFKIAAAKFNKKGR